MDSGVSHGIERDREDLIAELNALRDEKRALMRSEALLRTVVDMIGDSVYAKDAQGRYILANPAAARMLDRTAAEVLGRDDTDLFSPDFARQIMADDRAIMADGETGTSEQVVVLAGVSRTYVTTRAPFRHEHGPVVGVVGMMRDVTDRKWAEGALGRSEALPADSRQLAPVGSWNLDIMTGTLFWSDEQYRIFGLLPGTTAMTVDRFQSLVHPDDRELVQGNRDEAMRGGRPYEACYRVVHKDGTERIIQARGQFIFDDAGKPVRMFGSVQDITERKMAEETLQASEHLFRAVFEGALDAIVLADDDGRYVKANPAACRLFGLPLEDLLGRGIARFAEPGFDVRGAWAEFRRTGSGEGLFRLVRPDGTVRETEFTANADVLPGRHLSVLRDVSERRRAEEALRKSERRVVAILESITDGFFAVDRDWRIIYVNPQAGPLLGKSSAELLGMNIWDGFPEAIGLLLKHRCRRAMNERVAIAFEEYYPTPLGRWFNVHAYPSVDGLSVYFTDVTERKGAEDALRRYAERLAMLHETGRAILAARSSVQIA